MCPIVRIPMDLLTAFAKLMQNTKVSDTDMNYVRDLILFLAIIEWGWVWCEEFGKRSIYIILHIKRKPRKSVIILWGSEWGGPLVGFG